MSKKGNAASYPSAKRKNAPSKPGLPFWMWVGLGLLILVGAVAAIFMRPTEEAAQSLPREVNVVRAAELRTQGAFILDVREPDEWNAVHIPDATLIPLGQLEGRLNEVPKDQQVVVVCRSGNRSQAGRDILLEAGFTNVTSMSGGMNDWADQGFPTVSGP